MHLLKRCVQYLLLPYLSVDVILCAIGHGQEELQYVDSNTWTREYFDHEYFSDMFSLSKGLLSQFIKKHLSENCARGQRFYLSFHVAQVEKSYAHYPTIATRSLMTSILPERNLMKYSKLW